MTVSDMDRSMAFYSHVSAVKLISDMEAAWTQLRKHHVRQVSLWPQTIPISNPVAAGVKVIAFRDPDGHIRQIVSP